MEGTFIHNMFERAAMDVDLIDIKQWVAMPASALPPNRRTPRYGIRYRYLLSGTV